MPVDTLLGSIHVAARVGRLSSVAAALLLLLCSCLSVANVESSIPDKHFVSVTSAKELQEAGRAGVAHIVVQAHLDLVGLRSEPDLRHKVALDSAVIRVRQSTRSIVGRCNEPVPASFQLQEQLPLGACALLVREDFLDVPLNTDSIWLDSLYVAVSRPPGGDSSVLLLQTGGDVWLINSVLQGAGSNSRAIDVNTDDGGSPQLYIHSTTISHFSRPEAPGILIGTGGQVTLQGAIFRHMSLAPSDPGSRDVLNGTTIGVKAGAAILLQGVVIDGDLLFGQQFADRAVAVAPGPSPAAVYASPPMPIWQSPGGPTMMSRPFSCPPEDTGPCISLDDHNPPFLNENFNLRSLQQQQLRLQDDHLGRIPMPILQPPPPALTAGPGPRGPSNGNESIGGPTTEAAAGVDGEKLARSEVNVGLVVGVAVATAVAVAACMSVINWAVLRWDWRRRGRASVLLPLPPRSASNGGSGSGRIADCP